MFNPSEADRFFYGAHGKRFVFIDRDPNHQSEFLPDAIFIYIIPFGIHPGNTGIDWVWGCFDPAPKDQFGRFDV